MISHLRVRIALVCMLGLVLCGTAQADVEEADQRFVEGVSAFQAKQYPKAISLFQEAYRLHLDPNIAFNIATAYERAGDLQSARLWFETYVAQEPADAVAVSSRISSFPQPVAETQIPQSAPKARVNPKSVALAAGAVGVVTAFVVGGMALHASEQSSEAKTRFEQGSFARKAEGFALTADVTMLASSLALLYGASDFFTGGNSVQAGVNP